MRSFSKNAISIKHTIMHPAERNLIIKVFHRLDEIDADTWNEVGAGQPFASYLWHRYAEAVMADCRPLYILLFENSKIVGRAAFYLVFSEPIPLQLGFARNLAQTFFRRWPLLICRTPFAGLSGFLLSDASLVTVALRAIKSVVSEYAQRSSVSFVLFDFVERDETLWLDWRPDYYSLQMAEPGTQMELTWTSFDAYLSSLGKDERYHYRRVQRKAQESGIVIERHSVPAYMEDGLALIQNVERNHASTPNPWIRAMLENMHLVDSTWLTARVGERLVGCGLTLRDNGVQIDTALGLARDVPYAYFAMLYDSLKLAFESSSDYVRLGSGAYDVKRRLGFHIETNNYVVFSSTKSILNRLLPWMVK